MIKEGLVEEMLNEIYKILNESKFKISKRESKTLGELVYKTNALVGGRYGYSLSEIARVLYMSYVSKYYSLDEMVDLLENKPGRIMKLVYDYAIVENNDEEELW